MYHIMYKIRANAYNKKHKIRVEVSFKLTRKQDQKLL